MPWPPGLLYLPCPGSLVLGVFRYHEGYQADGRSAKLSLDIGRSAPCPGVIARDALPTHPRVRPSRHNCRLLDDSCQTAV